MTTGAGHLLAKLNEWLISQRTMRGKGTCDALRLLHPDIACLSILVQREWPGDSQAGFGLAEMFD